MDFSKFAFLAFLLVLAEAGPVYKFQKTDHATCALECSDNYKFGYQPGTVYEFSYDAKTTTKMNGASEDSAMIDMTATVEIEPLTKCDLVMKIKDASLRDSLNDEKSKEFQEAMMNQPLKFSFQDGRIDHICAMDGESTWVLNIKRGILSAFQNSMDNFDHSQNLTETDVVGTCLSEYKVVSNDRQTEKVEKTKNLLACTNREGYRLAIQSIGYNDPSYVKSLPLMKSEYKCTQTVEIGSNILRRSECSEEHVFRPFSNGKNGAMSKNIQTLTFVKTKKAGRVYDDAFSRRTSLLFEHQYDIDSRQEREGKVEEKLRELCFAAAEDIRPDLPEMLSQLAKSLREVNTDVYSRIYGKITRPNFCPKNRELLKKNFLDAIPMVGTAASVKAMTEFISKKYVTGYDTNIWLLSLSFIQRPSREMVSAANALLDIHNISEQAMLSVSSLASGYCNVRPDCGKDSEISALIGKLMETVQDCNPKDDNARKIIVALRALGNIGHSQEPVSRLSRCFTNREVPAEIRIAAMDAFRRIPCQAKRTDLMGVFRDKSEDSELRLNAYIALMKCPSKNVLSEVREVLEKEKSNQVGSFVWTHLTNLMETSDPHMQDIRNIVESEDLKKEFNLDQRKFSRNYEGSFFLDSINAGAKAESNVIFSEKSFIPRSANLNLTIDLFGQAINFLEIGGRVQGFEKYLQRHVMNFRRSVDKPERLGILKNENKFEKTDQLAASMYMRVFGNDFRYWNSTEPRYFERLIFDYLFKDKEDIQKSMSLLDSGVVIPTCIGLPLNLTVAVTGSLRIKRSINKGHSSVHLRVAPSAALQVKGEMTVDAHLSKAGIKMVSVAHTSTAASLLLSIEKIALEFPKEKTEIINLKSDFFIIQRDVEKKQKMLEGVMKKYASCTGDALQKVVGIRFCQQVQFPNASRNWQAPYFPFTGPVLYDLHIRNEDAPKGYELVLERLKERSKILLKLDTPDSKINRLITIHMDLKGQGVKVLVAAPWKNMRLAGTLEWIGDAFVLNGDLMLNNKNYVMDAALGIDGERNSVKISPYLGIRTPSQKMIFTGNMTYVFWKSIQADISARGFGPKDLTWNASGHILPEDIAASSSLTIGKNEYTIIARVGRLYKNSGFKYSPYLKFSVPSKDLVEMTSEINYDPSKKMTIDFKLDKLLTRPVTLNVFAVHNAAKGKNTLRIQFKAPRGNFRIIGDFSKKKSVISGRVIGSYTFGSKYSDRLTFSTKLRDLSVKSSARYLGIVELSSKKKGFLNFRLNGQLAKAANHLETKFDLQYGNPKSKATNRLIFSAVANRALKPFVHSYSYVMSIQHPGQNIDYKVDANHIQSSKWPFRRFENNVMVQMAPGKVVQTKVSYNNAKVKGLSATESEMSLSYPGRDMKITDKLTQVNKNTYDNHFTVQWQKGREAAVKSTYTKTGKDMSSIEHTLIFPNKKEAKVTAMLQSTTGDYKAKILFDAEENSISIKRVLYAAELRQTHVTTAKQTSKDTSIDIMWSANHKLSVDIGTVQSDTSMSSKLVLTTPFSSLKTFDTAAQYSWNNGKYLSMTKMSWNKKSEIRQDVSITHPGEELELNYSVSSEMEGKKSFFKFSTKKVGPKVSATVKVNVNDSPKFNLMLSHTNEKKHRTTEGSLIFDVLDTSAELKMSHTSYPLKKEIVSTGEGKLNLPSQKLKEIGASYSLKHNDHVTSIDIGYSSSLKNFKNGKLEVEINRNLPKMLDCDMKLTHMERLLLSIEGKYKQKENNFNINVDITDPYGEKIATSANIDLSSPRKTSNIEIKSKYMNILINGGFENRNGRFVDGELKMSANGQNLKISVNYEKDGATHKVSGGLILPDGRKIDGKTSLKMEDALITASLSVDSPDFPSLKNIDILLNFDGDMSSSVIKGYVKVLPYLPESEFEVSLTTKEDFDLAFVLKTPFGNMRTVKATVLLQGNQANNQKIKAGFELNKNKVIDLDISYKINSIKDFFASFDLKTSHRRLDSVTLFLKHSGGFSNMDTIVKGKVGREMKFNGKLKNSPSFNEMSLKGEFKDFDDFEVSFTRVGSLNDMQATLLYKLEGKDQIKSKLLIKGYGATINAMVKVPETLNFEYESEWDSENVSFNLRSSFELQQEHIYKIVATYEHLAKLYIKTSVLSYNDELTMTLNGDKKMFNALAKFTHNKSKYELIISNQGYYRKVDAQLITPFFTDMASFIFNGDEETFTAQAKFMHENDQYELVVSNRNHFEQITITLSTPFSSDKLDIDFDGDLTSFDSFAIFTHNKVEYKLQVSSEGYYQKLNAKLTTPSFETEILFTLKGNLKTFNSMLELSFNKKKIALVLSNKDYYKQMSIKLVTPFTNNSLMFSLDGTLNSFNAKVKYMNFKDVYELVVYNSGYYREIEAKLSTPYFRDMLSISVDGRLSDFTVKATVMHNHKNYQMTVSNARYYRNMGVELTTPFYEGSAEFSLKGNLQSFEIITKVMHNNEKFQLSLSTVNYYRQINAELLTPYFKESFDFLLGGTLRKFNVQLSLRHNKIVYEIKMSNKEFYRQMNLQLTTPFVSCNFQFEGTAQVANLDFKLNIGKAKYECLVSTKKYFQICELKLTTPKHILTIKSNVYYKKKSITGDVVVTFDGNKNIFSGIYKDTGRKKIIKADLKTPYFKENLQGTFAGTLRKFNANMKLQHNKDVYEVIASNKNYYNELELSLKAPGMKAKLNSEGNLQKCKVSASLKIANALYELTLSNQNYLRNVNVELSTPQTGDCLFHFALQGTRIHFDVESKFSQRDDKYELNVSFDRKTGEYKLTILSPQMNVNGHFIGDLKSFSFDANAVFNQQKYEVIVSTKNYFRVISAKLTTPQFGEQSLSVKINGQIRDFSGVIEVKNNNELYKSEFSLKNDEFRLSLPKWMELLQVKVSGNWKVFEFSMKALHYNGEQIEISIINKNFQDMKVHLATPQLEDIDVSVEISGNRHNGEATMKMSYGENVFENEVEISFDDKQASFEIEPQYTILGRSGKAKLQMDLMFEAQSFKYEFEADIEGTQVKSMASVKISPEINVLMTVNIPTLDASEMKLRIVSRGFQKTDIVLNLKSPWTGTTKVFYQHSGQTVKSFRTEGNIERDGVRLAGYSLNTDFSDDYSFDFSCDYDNSKNKIETVGNLRFQGVKTIGTLSVNTPFRLFKEVYITAETKMLRDGPSVGLDVQLPNQEHNLNIDLSNGNFNALLNLNMDKKNKDKQYQFQASYKNTDQLPGVSRSFNFKMVHPERTVSLDTVFENTEKVILARTFLSLGDSKYQKMGAEFEFQKGSKKSIKCKVNTPRRNVELFGSFSSKGNQHSTMGYIMLDAGRSPLKMEAKADIIDYSNGKNIDLLLKFPNQKNGMRMKALIKGAEGDSIFSGNAELSIDQDPAKTFIVDAKMSAQHQNYTLDLSVAHPATDLSAQVLTFVSAAPETFTAGIDVAYTTVRKQQQNLSIRGEILRLKQEFNLKMQAPSKEIELSGFIKSGNRLVMSVKKVESGKDDMEAALIVDPNDMNIRMDANYDLDNPSKLYRFDAAAQENKATLKAYRMEGKSRRGTDTRILAELRPSYILHLSFRWNPNFLQDFNRFMYEKVKKIGTEVKTLAMEVSEKVSEELAQRFELGQKSLMEDIRPVLKYFESEHESIYRDLSRYMRNFNEIYKKNSFYSRTIKDFLIRTWDDMWMQYKLMAYNLKVKMDEFNDFLMRTLEELSKEFEANYRKAAVMRENMSQLYKSIGGYAKFVQEYYFSLAHDALYSFKSDTIIFLDGLSVHFKDIIDAIRQHPFGAKMISIWSDIGTSMNNKQTQITQSLNGMTNALSSAHETANRHLDSFRHIAAVDAVLELLNDAYQQLLWSYRYWNVKSYLFKIRTYVTDSFYSKLNEVKRTLTDFDINTLVYAPKRGEIVVQIRYAAAMQVYKLMQSFMETLEELQQTVEKYRQMLPTRGTTFWDLYYELKQSTDVSEWLPPSKAHATLFAGQHITTFDGRHYDYKGTCSYVLARDFVHGYFTVVANFDPDRSKRTVKSITVWTEKKEIEIFSDYKIKFEGESAELPISFGYYIIVKREGDLVIVKGRRYTVTADLRLGLYTVDIDGEYFGKVAGMFGTYNNEQYDDMIMYNSKLTDNIEEFAESWWSGSSDCRSHRNLVSTNKIPDNQECHNYFVNTYSPFRNCFRQVNPDPFYHMCKTLRSNAYSTASDVCDVSAFYMNECRRNLVDLEMPKSCVSCSSIMGNKFYQGEDMVLQSSRVPAAADVVFVVEERSCLGDAGAQLPEIVKHLKSILQQKGLEDNRFGLIGFGSYSDKNKYIHTMGGEMMSNSERMIAALKSLEFRRIRPRVDVMRALMKVAEYPFRAGVRKSIVLVTCVECHETDVTTWELEQMLKKFDITLHVLADHDFKTKGNNTTHLYGADKSHTYTEGNIEMETNIVIPEDNCVQLALESNGSYFDSRKLNKEKASLPFMQSFAERVSESLMPTTCQKCECVPDQRGIGRPSCKSCTMTTHDVPVSTTKEISHVPVADEDFHRDLNNYMVAKSH